jgi:hypothetical protein
MGPFDDESFVHFFISCPSTAMVHREIESTLLNFQPDTGGKRWLGLGDEPWFLKIFLLCIQYFIWESKLRFRLPNANTCAGETIYLLEEACKISGKLKMELTNLNCPLSRHWDRLSLPRW